MSMFSGYSSLGAQIGWNMGCHMRDILQGREDLSLRQQLNYAWSVVQQKDDHIENRRQRYNNLVEDYEGLRHRFSVVLRDNDAYCNKANNLRQQNEALEAQVRQLQAQLKQSQANETAVRSKLSKCASEYNKVAAELDSAKKWKATARKVSAMAAMYNAAFTQLGVEVRRQFGLLDKEAMTRVWSKAEWAPVVFANSGADEYRERGLPLPAPFDDYDWSIKPQQSDRWNSYDLNYGLPHEVQSSDVSRALQSPGSFAPDDLHVLAESQEQANLSNVQ